MSSQSFFAEIISGSLQQWTAQCWIWDIMPHFGHLLVCEEQHMSFLGLVYDIKTGPIQTGRTPFAYQKTEEELKREQPHIFELLQTQFNCLTIGYQKKEVADQKTLTAHYHYASRPPKIHAFVREANAQELDDLFQENRYLPLIFNSSHLGYNIDELLIALFKLKHQHNLLNYDTLKRFIELYSMLIGNDYRRLKLFLHRIQPIIQDTSCSILSKIV